MGIGDDVRDFYLLSNDLQDVLYVGDSGNISEDPLFTDPENGDFNLMAESPCIDAGDPGAPYDPDSTIADMGCFYYDQQVSVDEFSGVLPTKILLLQNYPNPFNASTTIKYELPQQSHVTIKIYNILGQRVAILQDGIQPAGYHQLIWNTEDISSGVYFYRMQAGDYTESKKMILIR